MSLYELKELLRHSTLTMVAIRAPLGIAHRRALVDAHVGAFVEGKDVGVGVADLSVGDLLAVDRERGGSTRCRD